MSSIDKQAGIHLREETAPRETATDINEVKPDAMLQLLIKNYQKAADELSQYLQCSQAESKK